MKMKFKQLCSLVLAMAIVLSLVSTVIVPTVTAESVAAANSVVLSKTATLTEDGTYTIDLSGFATGESVATQVTSHTPLDIVLVLDASSSMLKFSNPASNYHAAKVDVKYSETGYDYSGTTYPADATAETNLVGKLKSFEKYFNPNAATSDHADGIFTASDTSDASYVIPVKPGDKIYCSSFTAKSVNGHMNGSRVTYFTEDGTLLKSMAPADVYAEFTESDNSFILVPEGAYTMNLVLWKTDTERVIKNTTLGDKYRPSTDEEFNTMRAKILQEQVQAFANALADNSKEIGMDHKLAIVTFGGSGDGTAGGTKHQGMYENYVGANGFNNYYFTNTGLFVDGAFCNYITAARVSDTNKYPSYEAVFAADLDTTQTYYYFEPTASAVNDSGEVKTVTYNTETAAWVNGDGTELTPQAKPYGSFSSTQFYTMTEIAPTEITRNQYKNAMTNVLENGVLNPDLQYAIDRYFARGTTHTEFGLAMADEILAKNTPRTEIDPNSGLEVTSQQLVILFTDGNTNDPDKVDASGNSVGEDEEGTPTYQTIFYRGNRIKYKGAKIYTISVADAEEGTDMAKWMDQLSSNHSDVVLNSQNEPVSHTAAAEIFDSTKELSDGRYYKSIENMSGLNEIFTSITTDITVPATSVTLNASAVMQDYLTNGLVLPEDFDCSNITISTYGIQTTDGIAYTTTNQDGIFTLDSETKTETGGTGKYLCTYTDPTTNEQVTKELYAAYDRATGKISVTNFDYALNYVAPDHPGRKLTMQITGVEATDASLTNEVIDTNGSNSGIYYPPDTALYPFETPKTQHFSKLYIVDYAKPFVIDPADWGVSVADMISGDRLKCDETIESEIKTDYGKFTNSDGTVTFTPTTMQWGEAASFYALCRWNTTPAEVTTGEYMWAKITVIPANNIYYEDDFTTVGDASPFDREGVVYTGTGWTTESAGTVGNGTENPEGATGDAESVHGFDESMVYDKHSDGSAHKGVISTGVKAEATFKFTGTGVDIYGLTTGGTGTVLVTLRGGEICNIDGYDYYEISETQIVDTQSVSGDYYQIPAVSFMDLPHGTYEVIVRITAAAKDRLTYYLDGVRVYNPMQDGSFYAENEQNATFTEIRDLLAATDATGIGNSAVFVDKTEAGTIGAAKNYAESDYGMYGPKNEVYLAKGQSITFKVSVVEGAHYYVGLKSPTGNADAKVKISSGADYVREIDVNHSTDLYYQVIPDASGYITIQNAGVAGEEEAANVGLLSLTKLRIAGSPAESAQILTTTEEEVIDAVKAFSLRPVADNVEPPVDPEDPEIPNVEDPAEPEATEPEVTEPEVTEPEATEPEVTEPEATEPEATEPEDPEVETPTDPEDPEDPEGPDDENPSDSEAPETGDVEIPALAGIVLVGLLMVICLLQFMPKRRSRYEA